MILEICKLKIFVLKLNREQLVKFRHIFFTEFNLDNYILEMIWNYIWDYISIDKLKRKINNSNFRGGL